MVKGTLIVNGARTPNSARKPSGARWTEWRTRGLGNCGTFSVSTHTQAQIRRHTHTQQERLLLNQWYIFSNTPNRGIYLRNDFFCLSSRRKSMWIDFFSVDISPLVRFYRRASRESERVKQIFGRSRGSPCRREKTF